MACQSVSCDFSCIAFKHSGGGANCEPCQDLGGAISTCDISAGLENLFHTVGPKLSRRGHEDYRCFYIQNASPTVTLRNMVIYFDGSGRQVPGKRGGTYVAMGVKLQSEIQQIAVTAANPPNNGEYFEISVPGYLPTFKVFYDPNITVWTGNFQTSIRAVTGLSEVVVTSTGTVPNVTFTVDFGGHDTRDSSILGQSQNRLIDLMSVTANTLLYGTATVTPLPVQDGSPTNTIAEVIPTEITPPTGIVFNYYFRGNPVKVGSLQPGDFVPIWIRRTLPIIDPYYGPLARNGQMAKLLDTFSIAAIATSP
jgi:hypothetical protein